MAWLIEEGYNLVGFLIWRRMLTATTALSGRIRGIDPSGRPFVSALSLDRPRWALGKTARVDRDDGTGRLLLLDLSTTASMGFGEFVGTLLRPRWALARSGLGLPSLFWPRFLALLTYPVRPTVFPKSRAERYSVTASTRPGGTRILYSWL